MSAFCSTTTARFAFNDGVSSRPWLRSANGVMSWASAREPDGGAGHQLNDTTMAFHLDPGGGIAWIDTDDHTLPADPQVQVQTAVVDRDRKHAKRFRPVRGQDDAIRSGFQTGEASLHEIDCACHRRQV